MTPLHPFWQAADPVRKVMLVGVGAALLSVGGTAVAQQQADPVSILGAEEYYYGAMAGYEMYPLTLAMRDEGPSPSSARSICGEFVDSQSNGEDAAYVRAAKQACFDGATCYLDFEVTPVEEFLPTMSVGGYTIDCSSEGRDRQHERVEEAIAITRGEGPR